MRPLFAIAPLAVVLALLGPTSQASQTDRSWTQTLLSWAFEQDEADRAPAKQHSDATASFRSLIDRVTH
ncbi:MAG TPA: hypothetical protein H9903_01525 [Candidatus Aquabacterium excrementipullorum]|nr:hypothetical protein [Candidatus Aquabacterium excrementipullorum]